MATFLKRQKEMKRLEKQREKAERRAQKKLAGRTQDEPSAENINLGDEEVPSTGIAAPSESIPHN
ncbi:MAG: hypothetical protein ABSG32_14010 [Terriglobia bacterium]|jgi:hypothetical protein